jgi:dTDP-4-amino-4,6-dideoxygalactose transaminase
MILWGRYSTGVAAVGYIVIATFEQAMSNKDQPAILGGTALRASGAPLWPGADADVAAAAARAVADGSWGRYFGPHGEALRIALADAWDCEHVVLCGSGTYAVELGLRALRVEAGDEVVLADYDFPGNFLNVHALGATPVLVDVAPGNWNMDVAAVEGALGPRTKAILVSHLHGGIVPMRALMEMAQARGVAVLEDACQCPGARIEGRRAGMWGDVGVVSFGGSKLLSAGRGGALLTAHADVAQRARTLSLRGNVVCPLSEIQAAILLPQIAKLDARNARRRARVAELGLALESVRGLRLFRNASVDAEPGYYKVGMQYDARAFGLPRERFVAAVRAEGIALDEGFAALHVGRSAKRYRAGSSLTEAERANGGCVVLHHPVLLGESEDVAQVSAAIRKVERWVDRLGP